MKFSSELRKYRERAGMTKARLADKIGVKSQYLISIENDHARPPTKARCEQLALALSLSEEEKKNFIDLAIRERVKDETVEWLDEKISVREIPLVSWVFANRFQNIEDPFPPGVSDEHILTTAKGENMFALRVKGNCMEPEFTEGDIVVVNPGIEARPKDFVIVKDLSSDEATFKQLKQKDKKLFLHPLNPDYKDIELDHKKQYKIVGKVVEKIKKY